MANQLHRQVLAFSHSNRRISHHTSDTCSPVCVVPIGFHAVSMIVSAMNSSSEGTICNRSRVRRFRLISCSSSSLHQFHSVFRDRQTHLHPLFGFTIFFSVILIVIFNCHSVSSFIAIASSAVCCQFHRLLYRHYSKEILPL